MQHEASRPHSSPGLAPGAAVHAAAMEKISFGNNLPGYVAGEVTSPAVIVIQVCELLRAGGGVCPAGPPRFRVFSAAGAGLPVPCRLP